MNTEVRGRSFIGRPKYGLMDSVQVALIATYISREEETELAWHDIGIAYIKIFIHTQTVWYLVSP